MKVEIKYSTINTIVIWGGFSVSNATLNRFFSLHYLLPFLLAALVVAHLIALHTHGSNNPNGIGSTTDRYSMHPYFTFKDLVTIFLFFLVLSIIVFYYPNLMGQKWPIIVLLIVYTINACTISWKYILNIYLVQIYNRTIFISVLFFNVPGTPQLHPSAQQKRLKFFFFKGCSDFLSKDGGDPAKFRDFVSHIILFKLNPYIVRYYYKIYNQQITKLLILFTHFTPCKAPDQDRAGAADPSVTLRRGGWMLRAKYLFLFSIRGLNYLAACTSTLFVNIRLNNFSFKLLGVGISETIRTHTNKIINKINLNSNTIVVKGLKKMSSICTQFNNLKNLNLIDNISVKDGHKNEISLKFKQWFAGITDGDGYIYVNKSGNVGFEMTLPSSDEKVLRIIQNKFGGNIHARAGLKAVRYRTQKRDTIIKIIHCLNGLVINNIRLAQLHKACVALNIPIKDPVTPTIDSAYISGLLDSDGSINFYEHKYNDTFRYQLTISIENKSRCNIEFLLNIIGGQIYFDKSKNGFYIWRANSKLLHLKLYNYFLKFPPKTIKVHRTYLIKEFHELNESKVYRETNILSLNYKIWKNFLNKWNNTN